MNKSILNSNFISIYETFKNLIRLFIISFKINNLNNNNNLYFTLLFIICLLASIFIRSNLITDDLLLIFYSIITVYFYIFLLIGLIYLSLIYITILIIRLLKRIFYSYKNIYQFIIYYKNGTKDINTIISFYYIQNIFFISLSLFIVYNILNKLYYLLNQNINLTIFTLTSVIFMIILIYYLIH